MSNWNFNGNLKENDTRVITSATGFVNVIGSRIDPSIKTYNNDGELVITLNMPATGAGGDGDSGSGIGQRTPSGGEIFNTYSTEEYPNEASLYSHAEGYHTKANGNQSHAEGYYTTANGDSSHAEGVSTTASGSYSHAEGYETTASGSYSHAEGIRTTASGSYSHAEGYDTKASSGYSHAEGYSTTASGNGSHAEGVSTTASGNQSHAEGYYTRAIGDYSHAEGFGTVASGNFQHVQGIYNIEDKDNKYANIVGGGDDDTDKNISTLDWHGNLTIAGDIYLGNTTEPLLKCLTQTEYDALTIKSPKTLYLIKKEE